MNLSLSAYIRTLPVSEAGGHMHLQKNTFQT